MKTQKTPTWDDVENARDLATGPQSNIPRPDRSTKPGKHYTTIREELDSIKAEHAALVAVAKAAVRVRNEAVHYESTKLGPQYLIEAIQSYDVAAAQLAAVRRQ